MAQPYDFTGYKDYIKAALELRDQSKRGSRSALAKAIGCQNAYVSHVLNGLNDFSLEQGHATAQFFELSEDGAHFFFLLLQRDRAGVRGLKDYYTRQIDKILSDRRKVQNRLGLQTQLSHENQVIYYSSWVPSAVHLLMLMPDFQSAERIAERLQLPAAIAQQTLEFLEKSGLIQKKNERWEVNLQWVYLPSASPLIRQHHTNWRLRALQAPDFNLPESLHHSGVIAISKEDALRVQKILLQAMEDAKKVVAASPEEDLFGLNVDFYRL